MFARSAGRRAAKRGLLAAAAVLFAASAAAAGPFRQGSVELLFGSYTMNEPRFAAVYPSSGPVRGLAFSAGLPLGLDLTFEARYFGRSGKLTFSGEETDFHLVPLSAGIRYSYPVLPFLRPYAGAGADLMFFVEDNPIGTMISTATGFHLQGGLYVGTPDRFPVLLNLQLRRTWVAAHENGLTLQLGGLEVSAGLAFAF